MTKDLRITSLAGKKWKNSISFQFDLPHSEEVLGKSVSGIRQELNDALNEYDSLFKLSSEDSTPSAVEKSPILAAQLAAAQELLEQLETLEFQNASRTVLKQIIEPVAKIEFSESRKGALRFGLDPSHDTAYENGRDVFFGKYFIALTYSSSSRSLSALRRDIESDANSNEYQSGTWAFSTIVHEVLHALGLKHPGNYNGGDKRGKSPFYRIR